MIASIMYNGNHFDLIKTDNVFHRRNAFTIIVGKNGTGKSRLLGKIASEFINLTNRSNSRQRSLETDLLGEGFITLSDKPTKLIAVSTSPFDKFPIPRLGNKIEIPEYSYLGIRELLTRNFGLAYMSKIIGALIEAIDQKPEQINEITQVLNYLGYSDHINIRLESRIPQGFTDDLLKLKRPEQFVDFERHFRRPYMSFSKAFFYNEDNSINKKKIVQLINVFQRMKELPSSEIRTLHLRIDSGGIHLYRHFSKYLKDFLFLMKCGILRLRDVTLSKLNSNIPFSITEASSGEQAVVISILGIASQINDNSIICIDEPEICLHPEWQERYIKILTSTFRMYSHCHFIIATHSPQIVSNLEPENSYILSLETGKTSNAKAYIRHSSDFQLANVFNSPGFKNEFLSRIALNVFVKVSRNKVFDKEDKRNYKLLQTQSEFLSEDDPVLQIFKAINEMYKKYGRHTSFN